MDNEFVQSLSRTSGGQFSSKSFTSSSFSTRQSSSFQQSFSQKLDNSMLQNMSSNFNQLSLDNPNEKFSNSAVERPFKSSLKSNFQDGGFPSNNMPMSFGDKSFSNISLSQKQSAQYSNRTVTSTVSSKVIRKKIIRKVVNGKIVEEEEEIDEIENEPVTQQFVEENSTNDITRTATIQQGGKLFEISQSKSCPEIKNKVDLRNNKPKAIEASRDRTSKLKNMFGIGKKKKKGTKDIGNIQPIINELLKTEENYVNDLRIIVDHFMPEIRRSNAPSELKTERGQYGLFGNVEIIFMFHDVQFLTDLKESDKNPEDIANCFLKHRKEFSLYRHFNRNQPKSEIFIGKYAVFFKEKIAELQVHDIRSFLIKPTQRLCRYTLLLEQLLKECEKHKLSNEDIKCVKEALAMLKAETRLGNDLMALDAIKDCDMDLKDQGELIYRDPFTVQRGSDPEFKAMVFLFEKIILFTKTKLENNVDVLYYQDFIYLNDIGLTECPNDTKTFKVWFHKHTLKPYTLKTIDKELKNKWVEEIRKQLQVELENTKKEQQNLQRRTLYNLKDIENEKRNINIIP